MESRYPGLSQALRNIFAKHVCNLPLYFSKDGSKLDMSVVGTSRETNLLLHLLRQFKPDEHDITLYPLLKDNVISSLYLPLLDAMSRTDRPNTLELYIRFRTHQESEERSFICHYSHQFLSPDMLNSFVKASCKNDVFFAYRIYLSRTGRPDMDYLARELSYIGNYAQHRAKALESKLWNVIAVGDVIDISQEVMTRLGQDADIIAEQIEKRERLLA